MADVRKATGEGTQQDKSRVLVALAPDTTRELDRIADKSGTSRLDIIRRALALYMLVDREVGKNPESRRVSITQDNKILESFILA